MNFLHFIIQLLINIYQFYYALFIPLIIIAFCFFLFELFFPINKNKKIWRKDLYLDFKFTIVNSMAVKLPIILSVWSVTHALSVIFNIHINVLKGYGFISVLPLIPYFILLSLLHDLVNYLVHYCFHHTRLWKFHAIHHTSKELDCLSLFRMHAIELYILHGIRTTILLAIGFSMPAIFAYGGLYGFFGLLVHSNINFTFGSPFKYIFVSPVFHNWHHTLEKEGLNKNFSTVYSFWDYLFKTNFLPVRLPEEFGIEKEIKLTFFHLFIEPFKKRSQ